MSLLPHVSINLILGLTLPTATLNRLEILIRYVAFSYFFSLDLLLIIAKHFLMNDLANYIWVCFSKSFSQISLAHPDFKVLDLNIHVKHIMRFLP